MENQRDHTKHKAKGKQETLLSKNDANYTNEIDRKEGENKYRVKGLLWGVCLSKPSQKNKNKVIEQEPNCIYQSEGSSSSCRWRGEAQFLVLIPTEKFLVFSFLFFACSPTCKNSVKCPSPTKRKVSSIPLAFLPLFSFNVVDLSE